MLLIVLAQVVEPNEGGFRGWLEEWAPAAEWGVAIGTLALAIATWLVARQTKREASAVRRESDLIGEQVKLQAEQLAASERPYVWPFANTEWLIEMKQGGAVWVIPFRNGGTGPAVNVTGAVWWDGGNIFARLLSNNLAAGDHTSVRLAGATSMSEGAFRDAHGFVRYHDIAGIEWQTQFRYDTGYGGDIRVIVESWGKTADLGEPDYPPGLSL